MPKVKATATTRADAHSRHTAIERRAKNSKTGGLGSKNVVHHSRYRNHHPAPLHQIDGRLPAKKSKYETIFEYEKNEDKKEKPLDVMTMPKSKEMPAGCTFVPIGNPELTAKCKDLSREQGAMCFIVTSGQENIARISEHMERIGYYFRSRIVQEAADALGGISAFLDGEAQRFTLTEVDTIPETQEEINKQADACLRDLFPRMPATDREQIIEQSFNKENSKNPRTGEVGVGLTKSLPLAKRCQLATNAHIRHIHTNYDKLLREYEYLDCRKAVEPICLEKIMKWRGDEETGRDQLDEILREIVIIPDSDDEDDELQFLGQVHNIPSRTPSPSKPASPSQPLVPYAPPRPFRSSATNIHPDDPRYGDWAKEQKKKRREEAISKVKNGKNSKKKKKRSMAEKESRKNFHRYQLFQQTGKRQGGNAASAGDGYHNNDENRHEMHQDYEQRQYNPGMDRQPLQDARYVQPFRDGNEMPTWRQDVRGHIPTGCDNSGCKRKLAHMSQESDHYQARDSFPEQRRLLRQFVDQHGRLIREYENLGVQRPPQYMHAPQQQYHPEQQRRITRAAIAPVERQDIIPSIERSMEAIDLADNPVRPLRPSSPYLVEHPRGVATIPQPKRQQVIYLPVQQSEPEYRVMPDQEVAYVRNGPDFVPQQKRRRIYQQSEEPIRVARYRGQPLPSLQRVVADPQPDMGWLDVERHLDPSQPIVISSSPLSQSIPAPVGAAPRLVHRTQQRNEHEFDDIFQHENQLQAQQRGAFSAKRQKVVSEQEYHGHPQEQCGHGSVRGQVRLVNHHAAYQFPVSSTHDPPVRVSVSQAPPSAYYEDGRAGLVEEIPVVKQYGERLGVKPVSVKNLRQQMAGGEPLYVRQANEHPAQTEDAQPQPQRLKPRLAHQITRAQTQQRYVVKDHEAEGYADGGHRGQHSQDYQKGSRHMAQHRPMPLRTGSELDQRQGMGGYRQGQSVQPHHARQPSATKYPEFDHMDDDGTQWFKAADGSVLPVMRPCQPTQAPQSRQASTMPQASEARYRQPGQMPQQYQQHDGRWVQNGYEQSSQPTRPLSGYKKGRRMSSYRNEGVIIIGDSP